MLGLYISTILTSAADSFNPIGITQQFVLQGMVKKPQHIWYFIMSMAITNLIVGYLAYYGLLAVLKNFADEIITGFGLGLFVAELVIGVIFLMICCWLIQNQRMKRLKRQLLSYQNDGDNLSDEEAAARKIISVSPSALVILGVVATISELTTALPYFAFLGILFQYQLSLVEISGLFIVYNTIYSMPLIILYFIYMKAREQFDRLYLWMKSILEKLSVVVAPSVSGLAGIFLIYHSVSVLIK